MKTSRAIARFAVPGLLLAGLLGAQPAAAADCYSIGQQIADQNGGQLANVRESNRGGQTVCVIVVLVPGKDGGRPRRQEFTVPAN
ncbi:hypothetical protein [Mesorhizobium marinum]|uniref:hypothetical protein n=1 Tax=Mesorhizobium marinum TaxID=3228790 RepID=UPI0034674F8C